MVSKTEMKGSPVVLWRAVGNAEGKVAPSAQDPRQPLTWELLVQNQRGVEL